MPAPASLDRRGFVRLTAAAAAALAGGALPVLSGCRDVAGPGADGRSLLLPPSSLGVGGATLTAAPGTAVVAEGASSPAWLFNGVLPGPTLRARRGDQLSLRLVNGLADPTIVHWHGLLVPEEADGHPRHAVGPGAAYDYAFPIVQRAGTFWYHPHAHHRTAEQVHRGLAGFFLVADDEEDALDLPSGPQEILLLLQDRDADASQALAYAPSEADHHSGMLRGTPFGNGIRLPRLDVVGACYRFRVVNASHARVYRLGLDDGAPLTVIGNDGGLLPSVAQVPDVYLGVGERVDLLLDFSDLTPGTHRMLRSLPFEVPTAGETVPQGAAMDLLEIVRVQGTGPAAPSLPSALSTIEPLGGPVRERSFVFRSTASADMHQINDLSFDMERIDLEVPLGEVERWVFENDSTLPHPVHLHGTHFQVASRAGGRGRVLPYELGWKDTVLVMPLERVEVLVRFGAYPGLFLLHCHNLQHEDLGMMLNVAVT